MKAQLSTALVLGSSFAIVQSPQMTEDSLKELYSSPAFIKTCPTKYLNRLDQTEGGPDFCCQE